MPHLSWEEFTHGIMSSVSSVVRIHGLLRQDVAEHFMSVVKELVEEEGVGDEHGEDDHDEVEKLTESKVEVISAESWLKLDEVVGDGLGLAVGSNDVLQHSSFEYLSPHKAGHLGEPKAEGQEEGQPEIVGGHGGICFRSQPGLVDEASSCLSL